MSLELSHALVIATETSLAMFAMFDSIKWCSHILYDTHKYVHDATFEIGSVIKVATYFAALEGASCE